MIVSQRLILKGKIKTKKKENLYIAKENHRSVISKTILIFNDKQNFLRLFMVLKMKDNFDLKKIVFPIKLSICNKH